jgi:hypothetical protein
MINRFLAAAVITNSGWALAACNLNANSAYPVVESITATPTQVTDTATPFTITAKMRSGLLEPTGALAAGLSRPGTFKILTDKTAEWRPAGEGGSLPTTIVYLPVTVVGSPGFGVVGAAQSQTLYLQFEPVPGGLAFKGYRTVMPSAVPSTRP